MLNCQGMICAVYVQHEHPQQIHSINRTSWRSRTFMSSYFQEGDWQV